MIEIDDAGSGSLIGGTGIGILRTETREYLFSLIPLSFFQEPLFQEKKYQQYVIRIVQEAVTKMKISKDEPIRVCRSYIFDELRTWLTAQGYSWESTKIEGPLQNLVEYSFSQYVISLGLPQNFVQHARYAFGFHRLFKWVLADFPNRAPLCKSGWKSWQRWSTIVPTATSGIAQKTCYCLKCGRLISAGEKIRTLRYYTNKAYSLELHYKCHSKANYADRKDYGLENITRAEPATK